ncbi:MAG: Nramp family divalent metal transporter [Bacteroidetes bacterium]|nr:Nramp family divalent metal transporter [Bacteroidota bacterium]MBT4411573.1 Nramp family divalent metal transporter [Bacteroidota bacterium]MBT7094637.1 Nramp family divalent metal transporter [Bacteroidota bacterium]MBT7465100.1 Nramp family divalent metal transporter [Bacteroidota bacterium]
MKNKVKIFIASIMPGIFIIGYNVGTGSVTSMSKAGANFGFDLLWAVLLSCMITYYLILKFSKYTMVTRQTFIQGVKKQIHPALAIGMIIPLSLVIIAALIGLLGVVSNILEAWSTTISDSGFSAIWWAIVIAWLLYLLLWNGSYAQFEKFLAILVAIMGSAFIATMFINFPSIKELASGLIPKIPEIAQGSDNNPMVIVAGLVGTTVSVFTLIIRSQIIKETGWKIQDAAKQKRDALISATMMFVISAAVLITAATTLHLQGIKMNSVVEMIPLLEPIAGKAALSVFTLGILAAGLSSHLPNLLIIPWLIIDYREEPRDTRTPRNRSIMGILTLISTLGVAFSIKPVFLLLLSQASIAIILPVSIGSLFYLTSNKKLMGTSSNKALDIIILSLIMAFSMYVSVLGIKGVFIDIFHHL